MKNIYIALCLMVMSISYGQVGNGTTLPLGSFHIDAKKDNAPAANPTAQQVSNDLIVNDKGQVGVGTLKPEVKLDVKGDLQVQDGVLKIKVTPLLDNSNVKVLAIDKQGVVGTKEIEAPKDKPLAIFQGKSDLNKGTTFLKQFNDAIYIPVPFDINDFTLKIGDIVTINNGDAEIKQDGYYQLSGTINIMLKAQVTGQMYFKAQILKRSPTDADWVLISGIRPIFGMRSADNATNFPFTFPSSIVRLNKGDLIRMRYSRSASVSGNEIFGVAATEAYLSANNDLKLYPYQIFISKL